jgi:hypothetical protein
LNGPLYILDKNTKKLSIYLDFNGRQDHTGLFHKFAYETGYANGLVSMQFDPDYRRNGRFYTVHIEDPSVDAPAAPDGTNAPGLNVRGYETTKAIVTPGEILREGVLVEWTDTNTANGTFEGSARELMRVQLNTRIHPLGDLVFNPAARRGDTLYVRWGEWVPIGSVLAVAACVVLAVFRTRRRRSVDSAPVGDADRIGEFDGSVDAPAPAAVITAPTGDRA